MDACDRAKIVPYRCYYTWDIHYACNYRCSYCLLHDTWDDLQKKNRYPGLEKWKRIWGDIYAKYGPGHIHISGGEPFFYPDIFEFVEFLVTQFTVEFDTNLSFDVNKLMVRVPPGRIKICATFHPEFANLDEFIAKAVALISRGYDIAVSYVAYPKFLDKLDGISAALSKANLPLCVMPFRGVYNGLEYPRSYTKEEAELLCKYDPKLAIKGLNFYGQKSKHW